MDKEFLSHIRRSLGKPPVNPRASRESVLAETANRTSKERKVEEASEELVKRFIAEATAVGAFVHRVKAQEEIQTYLKNLINRCQVKRAVRWNAPICEEFEMDEVLRALGIEVTVANLENWPTSTSGVDVEAKAREELRSRVIEADLGISGVEYALAETGTLVLMARKGQGRAVTLLPPVHLALMKARQVVASLDDLFTLVRESFFNKSSSITSCMTFITGPSRTGDIELTLTIGVHGPRELHILIV